MEPTPPLPPPPPPSFSIPTNEDNNKKERKKRIIGKGRKKIEIKKIENKKKLDICFSKRYRGFLSMAEELSILCGVDVAAIVFSPTGKAYSFSNTSVEQLIDKLPPMPLHQDSYAIMEKVVDEKFKEKEEEEEDDDGDEDDDEDEEELNMNYDDAMVQEKMEELRGIISLDSDNAGVVSSSTSVKSDHDDQCLVPCVFNPFLAAIGDLHLVLGPTAPSPSFPFI
ncbi:SRF-like protein [Dioscorea alata]|uniref:SRF-like protein n=1 Tax=Dioscorea alata TaxID=55571 RepID=A0ACB7VES9_DIOAL|nr:SRF-like protein [Dioscorea alata]